jgi:hypothetical protein
MLKPEFSLMFLSFVVEQIQYISLHQKVESLHVEHSERPISASDFYFPHMKFGKYWFHLRKKIIDNFHVLGLPKKSDALVGACKLATYW